MLFLVDERHCEILIIQSRLNDCCSFRLEDSVLDNVLAIQRGSGDESIRVDECRARQSLKSLQQVPRMSVSHERSRWVVDALAFTREQFQSIGVSNYQWPLFQLRE